MAKAAQVKVTPEKPPKKNTLEKLYDWVDTFHNVQPERHPSRTGCLMSMLMIPVVLTYTVIWFVDNQSKPPSENLIIEWSVAYGPYPMRVQCVEASCSLYLSGCESASANRCIELAAGEETELEMCYSAGAREGLHAWWSGSSNSSGLKIYSQALTMWMNQKVEAGRSQMTYVKTQDKTKESGDWEHERHEWFVMYLSNQVLEPVHSGCSRTGEAAQIVMKPEFYEKEIFREDFVVSLIGEVGGAYGIISTIFLGLYIILWNMEYGYHHRQELMESSSVTVTTVEVSAAPPTPLHSKTSPPVEQLMMYPFAGQMHLCDFGASIKECPDAPNCKGPMGTSYSMPRLYSFPIWSTRVFVRDSLKAVFPEMAERIEQKVDPGEYGLESYHCRLACIFLFMLAVVEDLKESLELARTLWRLPSQAEPWIKYAPPLWATKEEVKKIKDMSELDFVKFKVAGIPSAWKAFYWLFVLLPKFGLWLAVAKSGVQYLMETAGIVDTIVNAMALTFVLEVDEMVFHRFTTNLTKHIMNNIEDLPNFDTHMEDTETDQQALDRFHEEELGVSRLAKLRLCIPWRLCFVLLLQVLFISLYYHENCDRLEDGSWVSKELRLPKDLAYHPLALMFGLLPRSTDEDPVWSMPSD